MKVRILLVAVSAILGFLYCGPLKFDATTVAILIPMTVLTALIFAACGKEAKESRAKNPPLTKPTKKELLFYTSILILIGLFLYSLSILGLVDRTSITIALPSTVLMLLVLLASMEKGVIKPRFNPKAVLEYILPAGLSFALLNVLMLSLHWGEKVFTPNTFEQTLSQIVYLSTNTIIAVVCTSALFFLVQIILNSKQKPTYSTANPIAVPLFKTGIFGAGLFYLLPLSYFFLGPSPSFSPHDFEVVKETYRLSIALSTIPFSAMGIGAAFYSHTINTKYYALAGAAVLAPLSVVLLTLYSFFPAQCHTFNGHFLESYGMYDQAIVCLDRAIKNNPDYKEANDTKNRILEKKKILEATPNKKNTSNI